MSQLTLHQPHFHDLNLILRQRLTVEFGLHTSWGCEEHLPANKQWSSRKRTAFSLRLFPAGIRMYPSLYAAWEESQKLTLMAVKIACNHNHTSKTNTQNIK